MSRSVAGPVVVEALGALLKAATALVCVGCGDTPEAVTRRIVVHALPGCEWPLDRALLLNALGDFAEPHAASISAASTTGASDLMLPFDLRGVEATSSPSGFAGVGYGDPPSDVSLTVWPSVQACDALPPDKMPPDTGVPSNAVPPNAGGIAMTVFGGGVVMLAGLDPPDRADPLARSNAAFALAWDSRNGKRLDVTGLGANRRAWATATAFGNGALIAGGIDPGVDPVRLIDSALVFRDGAFKGTVMLTDARTRHGATVLANGETLLVGGEGTDGRALFSLEAIAPDRPPDEMARTFRLGALARARKSPSVLRLADDRILVASGVDDDGNPVGSLEWFESDGGPCTLPPCVVTPPWPDAKDRAFVPLAGGGALAVGGTDASTGTTALASVWWILPEREVVQLGDFIVSVSQPKPKTVRLVSAADASPWLWNGQRWFRFDPWRARFVVPESAPDDGPDDDAPSPVEVDPGLFAWLARERPGDPNSKARLRGFRHGVRGPLTTDLSLLAETSHTAPNRPPKAGLIEFDAQGLHLAQPIATPLPPRVVVTDALYGDFDLSGEGAANAVLPQIEIGDRAVVGSGGCPWPSEGRGLHFSVGRRAEAIDVDIDGVTATCNKGPTGRVAIAFRAPLFGEGIAHNVTITRR